MRVGVVDVGDEREEVEVEDLELEELLVGLHVAPDFADVLLRPLPALTSQHCSEVLECGDGSVVLDNVKELLELYFEEGFVVEQLLVLLMVQVDERIIELVHVGQQHFEDEVLAVVRVLFDRLVLELDLLVQPKLVELVEVHQRVLELEYFDDVGGLQRIVLLHQHEILRFVEVEAVGDEIVDGEQDLVTNKLSQLLSYFVAVVDVEEEL